jgi:hypothetical protein
MNRSSRRRGLLVVAIATVATIVSMGRAVHATASVFQTIVNCTESAFDTALDAATDGGTITFGCSGTIPITATKHLAGTLTLDGSGQVVTFDGNNKVLVFKIEATSQATIRHLTIKGGQVENGGGGINNRGSLTVTESTLDGNANGLINEGLATISATTFTNNRISAIYNSNQLIVKASTFTANNRGIDNASGSATVANSTFYANKVMTPKEIGGAIANSGSLTVINSTLSGNIAPGGGGAIGNHWHGVVLLQNTILANSNRQWNCFGPVQDGGHNLQFPVASCGPTVRVADPKLIPLADNGGPTQTMALLPSSPAIGAGDLDLCARAPVSNVDQRGSARTRPSCDIGAFESRASLEIFLK